MEQVAPYKPINKIRIVTAASLFDGHDAAINIMRRIIQATGCEVIHLGHDRSVEEVVDCAIQEDAQAIAMTSYQGGHIEYFKYMCDLLKEKGAPHIKIFGGGGGTILPTEIKELHDYGITRIYHPDDGRTLGLQGMINNLVEQCDFPVGENITNTIKEIGVKNIPSIARAISAAENFPEENKIILNEIRELAKTKSIPVLGITGTGGSGKSSLVDELVRRFLVDFGDKQIAVVSVDPSKRKTGGALLGDRIRMNSIKSNRVYMRSLATRQSKLALSKHVAEAISILKVANYDLIILETSGIGQSDTEILDHSDVSLYVMTPEYGAATQLEKIDMLDFADVIALNKFDKRGALDALRDVRKQYQRNHNLWEISVDDMPVHGTIASQFNDPGMNSLYKVIMDKVVEKTGMDLNSTFEITREMSEKIFVIPPDRTRYLSEISENNRSYDKWVNEQVLVAEKLYGLNSAIATMQNAKFEDKDRLVKSLQETFEIEKLNFDPKNWAIIQTWKDKKQQFKNPNFEFKVREKIVKIETHTESLSHSQIPKVSSPKYSSWGDILRWVLQENYPGEFPYTAGLFPFKREGEDPTRMFAGEGGPERTNKRFHYVSLGLPAKRLSTAFDSVTLYGNDPDLRPDIYGKIGNSGVSICCLDDAKKLYSGFDLTNPSTSVSMTINGPAPMLLGFFMNAAIDQNCEKYITENSLEADIKKKIEAIYKKTGTERPKYQGELPEGNNGLGLMLLGVTGDQVLDTEIYSKIKTETLKMVRGTVQADILKEDQAQNTCIFSTEFALRLMGDVQQYFIDNGIRNFYSVSISGYHIAEAGANPITQLAFTLANGFTYVEYYLSRGMNINDFGPNLSFFFSNGIDPEYAVIG
ncbi:MAG: methylmalonyl-CoA mutase family protein, partial [Flavobacteriia bacterium]|nr:methylmalonyl-CoA mutase family protein [Flavobacteriia bacterium]